MQVKIVSPGKKKWSNGAVMMLCADNNVCTLLYDDGKISDLQYAYSNALKMIEDGLWTERTVKDWIQECDLRSSDVGKAKVPALEPYSKGKPKAGKKLKTSAQIVEEKTAKINGPITSVGLEAQLEKSFSDWWEKNQSEVMFSKDIFMAGANSAISIIKSLTE